MYLADDTVTIVRHIETIDGDSYSNTVIHGVSWKRSAGDNMGRQGETPVTSVTVRIPEENLPDVLPTAGDYIVRGVASVNSLADLKGREYFRVSSISDNLRGIHLRHLAVNGNAN